MVMPYGRKVTQVEVGKGPGEIDFNALWDRAYVPVITELGYEPVRADQDTDALIITQMLERLYFADLVLADMTIPNGNVYYEVGVRHAARETGCVLLAADWSKQLFDAAQMRTVHYPLPEGEVVEATADAIRKAIIGAIPKLGNGSSPVHQSIPGYPTNVNPTAAKSMKDQLLALAAFQAEVRAVRSAPRGERMDRARKLVERETSMHMTAPVALALLLLLRDCTDSKDDWNVVLGFIERLPENLSSLSEVIEQRALALSYAGWHVEAIAALDALVETQGPTQERLGLLGGRHKRLFLSATDEEDRQTALARAIDYYERGMELDLNEYYCASNLPRLYRARASKGDEEKALAVLHLVVAACERASRRGTADRWMRPTLLVAAFDAGDADKAEQIALEVENEGAESWKLESIIEALRGSLSYASNEISEKRLANILSRLEKKLHRPKHPVSSAD